MRRPRGRYYRFRRGRWRRFRRLRSRFRSRFRHRRIRHRRRRRRFKKIFRRAFFNPHPGTYVVRRANPYNTLRLLFQGIIMIPHCIYNASTAQQYANYTLTAVRAASIGWTLGNLLRAVMPLDSGSKLGGVPATALESWTVTGGTSPGTTGNVTAFPPPPGARYPFGRPEQTATQVGFDPSSWWRWALALMYPLPKERNDNYPLVMSKDQMYRMFGGYQLYRHIVSKFKILCTRPAPNSSFSPVASLVVQDGFWNQRGRHQYTVTRGGRPFSGAQPSAVGSTNYTCNETTWPAHPPTPFNEAQDQGMPWVTPGGGPVTDFNLYMNASYADFKFPSFAVLSALGAPWTFPPQQKPIMRGSFTKHTIKGTNDPQGERWWNLLPRRDGGSPIPDTNSDIDNLVATIFLAQGSDITSPVRFGTAQYTIKEANAFQQDTWCIIKFKSMWALGNQQRPYLQDINYWIATANSANRGANLDI
ncbi:VP1 [Pigeon gyrovirus]|nr:VP1 [Pigeon gyrovirus]